MESSLPIQQDRTPSDAFRGTFQTRVQHLLLGQKGCITGLGVEPDLGPVPGRDYGPFMPGDDEEIVWPSEDKIEDATDDEGGPSTAA